MSKDKTLCKWKKDDLADDFSSLLEAVKGAKFVCMKCGRAAAAKKWLCKPKKLD